MCGGRGKIRGYLHRHGSRLISINESGTRALLCACCAGSCCLVGQKSSLHVSEKVASNTYIHSPRKKKKHEATLDVGRVCVSPLQRL